jgi:hypothetical protein
LRFFHFSGFDPDNTDCLSRHQSRFQMSELPAVKRLAQQYSRLLHDYGYERCHRWPYAYGYFSNGVRIPDLGRPLHQECPGITKTITDPFSEEGYRAFVAIWNEPVDRTVNGRPAITRLAYRLYRTRHDLQGAMPNVFNGDYRGFVQWLTSNAAGDHDLPDIFLAPFRTDAVSREKSEGFDATAVSEPCLGPLTTASTHAGMTRLAIQIYAKRPDLQAFFPDPSGEDSAKYLVWLLSYGKRQYALSEVYLSTLRRQWLAQVDRLPNFGVRLRYRILLSASVASAAVSPLVARTIRIPNWLKRFMRRSAAEHSVSESLRTDSALASSAPGTDPRQVSLFAQATDNGGEAIKPN